MKQANFVALVEQWRKDEIITPEQSAYMLHELRETGAEQAGTKFITAIVVAGAAVLSAGVLLLIASNWSYLGKTVKLLLALIMPVLPLAYAYYSLVVEQNNHVFGRAANIFGVALIGGTLALIGQIYNLEANYASFTLMWALLSTPFVFVFKRAENVGITAVLFGFALVLWLVEEFSIFNDERVMLITMTVAFLAYAALMYTVGTIMKNVTQWAAGVRVLRLLSASVAATVLFISTFEFYAKEVLDIGYRDQSTTWAPLMFVLNVVFVGFLVFVLLRAYRAQEETLAFGIVRLLFLYIIIKYFTLFSSMLDTGILMIVGGILFISGAWYMEKNKARFKSLFRNDLPSSEQFTAL